MFWFFLIPTKIVIYLTIYLTMVKLELFDCKLNKERESHKLSSKTIFSTLIEKVKLFKEKVQKEYRYFKRYNVIYFYGINKFCLLLTLAVLNIFFTMMRS